MSPVPEPAGFSERVCEPAGFSARGRQVASRRESESPAVGNQDLSDLCRRGSWITESCGSGAFLRSGLEPSEILTLCVSHGRHGFLFALDVSE